MRIQSWHVIQSCCSSCTSFLNGRARRLPSRCSSCTRFCSVCACMRRHSSCMCFLRGRARRWKARPQLLHQLLCGCARRWRSRRNFCASTSFSRGRARRCTDSLPQWSSFNAASMVQHVLFFQPCAFALVVMEAPGDLVLNDSLA